MTYFWFLWVRIQFLFCKKLQKQENSYNWKPSSQSYDAVNFKIESVNEICNIKYSLFRLKNRSGVWWCYYDGGVWVWVPCACVWRESRGPLKNSLSNAAISLVQTRSAAPPWPWVAKEKFYFIFINNLYYIKVNNLYYIKLNN